MQRQAFTFQYGVDLEPQAAFDAGADMPDLHSNMGGF